MNKGLTLLSGIGLGTGLMFLLDPAGGRRRRAMVRDKAAGALNATGTAFSKTSRDMANRARGIVSEAKGVFGREGGDDIREMRDAARHGRFSGLRRANWPPAWRVFGGIGGGALAYYGLRHRGPLGTAASAAGFTMLARSTTNRKATRLFGLIRRAA